jgi:hypothetical protein
MLKELFQLNCPTLLFPELKEGTTGCCANQRARVVSEWSNHVENVWATHADVPQGFE